MTVFSLLSESVGDGIVVKTIVEAMWNALSDWWWFWLLFTAFIVASKMLTDWSKRVEARSKPRRRP